MDGLELAEFLADLRGELARAEANAREESLKLGVDQIEVSLEVTSTLERSGGVDARVKAKFWVFPFAEGGVKGAVTDVRSRTQHLKLTLTPRVVETVTENTGVTRTVSRGVDVHGQVQPREENPALPPAPAEY